MVAGERSGDALRFLLVEATPGSLDCRLILTRPSTEATDRRQQRSSELSQFILDARRNRRKNGAAYKSVAFQPAQRQGQHALRDTAKRAAKLVETLRAVTERGHNQHRPLVADARKHLTHGAAFLGQMQVTWYQPCAFLPRGLGHLSILVT